MSDEKLAKSIDRVASVLGVLLVHKLGDTGLKEKVLTLRSCGFSNAEIARMLHSTTDSVKVIFSSSMHKKKGKGKRR